MSMDKVSIIIASIAGLLTLGKSEAAVPSRVSVLRFKQEADHVFDHCRGWDYGRQDQLQTELERELSLAGLKVLERRDIRRMFEDEHGLPNLDRRNVPKGGKFLSAEYAITGGVTELGICEESSDTSIQLGGVISLLGGPSGVDLDVARQRAVSKVKLVAEVVSVETGEILKSLVATSEVNDSGYAVDAQVMGIGGKQKERKRPPIERATHQAIGDLGRQIAEYLRLRNPSG